MCAAYVCVERARAPSLNYEFNAIGRRIEGYEAIRLRNSCELRGPASETIRQDTRNENAQ